MIRVPIVFVLFLCVATAAQAQPAARTVTVALAGLNLSDPADRARLDARIHEAAVVVCGPTEYPLGVRLTDYLEARQRTEACIRRTERNARARLAALHPQAAPAVQMAAAGH